MKHLLLAATLFAGAALPAVAEDAQCFQNEHYLVVFEERTNEVGSDFIVRPPARGKIACLFQTQDGDIRIGEPEDPLYFTALAGPYLVLSRSTGPDGNVVIYDLDAGAFEPIVDVPADDEVEVTQSQVVYWERTREGNGDNCPAFAEHQSYDLGSVIAEQRVFDVETGTISSTGLSHCSQTQ